MSTTAVINIYVKTYKGVWKKVSEATSNVVRDLINWSEIDTVSQPTDFHEKLSEKGLEYQFPICKDEYKIEFGSITHRSEYGGDCIIVNNDEVLKMIEKVKCPDKSFILPGDRSHFIYILKEKEYTHNGFFYNIESFNKPLASLKKRIKLDKKQLKKLENFQNTKDFYLLNEDQKEDFNSDMNDVVSSIIENKAQRDNIKAFINVLEYFRDCAWFDGDWFEDVIAYIYIE